MNLLDVKFFWVKNFSFCAVCAVSGKEEPSKTKVQHFMKIYLFSIVPITQINLYEINSIKI